MTLEIIENHRMALTAHTPDEPYSMWRRVVVCLPWKTGNELLIIDYPNFAHREMSIEDAALMGTDSIYIYRLPHLPFLKGIQGL